MRSFESLALITLIPLAAEPTEVIHMLRRVNLLAKNWSRPELVELARQYSLVALEYRWSS